MPSGPFTGVTVVYNEAQVLEQCLASMAFCDDLLVLDLGSSDGSPDVARSFGARVIAHEWVPIVEVVGPFLLARIRTPWVVLLDPDMVLPAATPEAFRSVTDDGRLGIAAMHYQNFYREQAIHYGTWGGSHRTFPVLLHRDRVELGAHVHQGISPREGYTRHILADTADLRITHLWGHSWRHLIDKHKRYIEAEGRGRLARGETFSWRRFARLAWRAAHDHFLKHRGYRDGLLGLQLGYLWFWYVCASQLALRRELTRRSSG